MSFLSGELGSCNEARTTAMGLGESVPTEH